MDFLRGIAVALLGFDVARRYLLAPEAYPGDGFLSLALVRAPNLLAVLLLVFLQGWVTFTRHERIPTAALGRSLALGGLVLIALELTLVRAVAWFTMDYTRAIGVLDVFWAVGASMVVLALLVQLTVRDVAVFAIVALGVYLIVGGIEPPGRYGPGTAPGLAGQLWILLLGPAEIFRPVGTSGPVIGLIHPVIPFAGIAAAGYACRALGRSRLESILPLRRFPLHVSGPHALPYSMLATLGRYPMFCYVVQLFAIHLLAVGITSLAGMDPAYLFISQPFEGRPPAGSGFGFAVVTGCWLAGMLIAEVTSRTRRGGRLPPVRAEGSEAVRRRCQWRQASRSRH